MILGVKVSKSHVWRILHEAGIVHKRPKAVVESPDPHYGGRPRRLEATSASLQPYKKGGTDRIRG